MSEIKNCFIEKVAILDFGAQYGKVIDRRVRECNVYSELLPLSTSVNELMEKNFGAVIISGGPNSVYVPNAPCYDTQLFQSNIPILGICYGFQLINKEFGGTVAPEEFREDGQTSVEVDINSLLFDEMDSTQKVLLTHGDSVTESSVANGLKVIARSGNFVAGVMNHSRKIYGVQFHPEVDLTENGKLMISNFLRKIVGFKAIYTIENREKICIEKIQQIVKNKKVLVMVSGGVDSTVCAALLHKALGPDNVVAIHIDNGFMRLNESETVVQSLNKIGLNVKRFTFVDEFLNASLNVKNLQTTALKHTICPESKRMIIGDTFIKCKDIAVQQGTLRPDLIESASELASGCAEVIKTHHNDTALVRELRNLGKVIEPLSEFHKDEVRELGQALGLPDDIINRHPFPGPGLAIRILCADKPFIDENYEKTVLKLNEFMQRLNYTIFNTPNNFYLKENFNALVLPIKSVGVQGDKRTYSYVVALTYNIQLESIKDNDIEKSEIPWSILEALAKLITNQIHTINRVVYLFGGHCDNLNLSITPTFINEATLEQLQLADNIVYKILCGSNNNESSSILSCIQQMPVILVPIHFDNVTTTHVFPAMCRSICLRPFITQDFMTGKAALPGRDIPEKAILEMVKQIKLEVPFISRVMIDLTAKPPGTTEWE